MSGKAQAPKKAAAKKPPAGKGTPQSKRKAPGKDGEGGKKRPAALQAGEAGTIKKRGLLGDKLRMMMYGHGDAAVPYQETVELVEDITVDYIVGLIKKAMAVTGPADKIGVDDILFVLRKDRKKYNRAKELLRLDEDIKRDKRMDGMEPTFGPA